MSGIGLLADRAQATLVTRRTLLARLQASDASVAVLAAPAGSGKSTVLRQWAAVETRPVAWVQISPAHLDAMLLIGDIGRAIAETMQGGPVADVLPRLDAPDPLRSLTRLSRAMAAEKRGALLVLDDVHMIHRHLAALDTVVALVDQQAAGWTIVMAQREEVALPTARWRLARSLIVLGMEDLAFDAEECAHVLSSLGVVVTDALVAEVLERTEGWAAGVYLAGLSLRSDRPMRSEGLVAGDDELVRSYLDSEILSTLDPADRELLLRTSIVDEVNGALAESLTGDPAAGERLLRISGQNLLVSAVDRQQRWFRCHSLLRERLLRELEDTGPTTPALHAKASTWYEENGRTQEAVAHAFASRDHQRVERLVVDAMQEEYRTGRVETFRAWLDRLEPEAYARNSQLALSATWFAALEGDVDACTRWAASAHVDRPDPIDAVAPPDGLDHWVVRAMLAAHGPEQALDDASGSLSLHGEAWRWRSTALTLQGAAHFMLGDQAAAIASYEAVERCPGIDRAAIRLCARAEQALHAMGRRAWGEAEQILARDRSAMIEDRSAGRLAGTLWLCADARMSLHRGDVRGTVERLRRAQMQRTRLTWGVPWFAVRCLSIMAQTELLVGDSAGAHASLAQARDIARVRPRLGVLIAGLDEIEARARQSSAAQSSASALSPAELRLLPFIQTYLSFKEIGQRLGISVTTVKTEVLSIYAKLGASSRSEAVELAVECGLLEDPFA